MSAIFTPLFQSSPSSFPGATRLGSRASSTATEFWTASNASSDRAVSSIRVRHQVRALPGSGFDLWREDEERRRVKTIVGAFAERPKLPKMVRPLERKNEEA